VGVILLQVAICFGIFLMRTLFRGIPNELIDAARIDGATEFQTAIKIFLPFARPGLKALALISLPGKRISCKALAHSHKENS